MAEAEIKGEIKGIGIKEGTMKLTIESPLNEPSMTFLLPLLNRQISMIFTDHQTMLPLEEEET
jgi:hypothetical protein